MKNKINRFLCAIQLAIIYSTIPIPLYATEITLPGLNTMGITNVTGFWNKAIDIVRICVMGLSGILTVALVGVFAYKCFNLAASSNNPGKRAEVVKEILYTVIGIGLFGGTTLITGLAVNLFR